MDENPTAFGNSLPFVSIVIPVRNGAADVAGCISTLRALDYPRDRFEILVVDNGSADDTVAALAEADVEPLHHAELGRSRALNRGLEAARGEIICSTDISCRPEPQWLREVVSSFSNPEVGCVAGEIKLLKQHDNVALRYQESTGYMSPMGARFRYRPPFLPYADGANASFRRAVFDQIGPFEESFIKGADVEICYRMLLTTDYKIAFNEAAAVWEAGEETLQQLLRQRFRIGLGNVLMRRRFPELFQRSKSAVGLPRRCYWKAVAGLRRGADMAILAVKTIAGKPQARASLETRLVETLMSWAQALGRRYGRWYVSRAGIEIEPVRHPHLDQSGLAHRVVHCTHAAALPAGAENNRTEATTS